MIEVVAAVLTAVLLPGKGTCLGLMLHHDALFEFGVIVLAAVSAILGDFQSIELFDPVLLRSVFVSGDYVL